MYFEDFFIEILLGGKIQWCYDKRFNEWSLRLLYYKTTSTQHVSSQVLQHKPLCYYSGFVSRERGRHWNRKRKR